MKKKNLMIVGLMGCLCFVGCGAEEAEMSDTVFSKVEYQHDTVQQETVESVVETEVVETLEELQTNDSNVSKGTMELLQSKPIESEDETEETEEVDGMQLPSYEIYNEEEGYGFQSEAVEDYSSNINVTEAKTSNSSSTTTTGSNALDEAYDEIAYAESIEASCDSKMQASGNSQAEMARFAANTYDAWDYAINSIWVVLREELSSSEFNTLLTEQRAWVDEKKSLMKKAGASCVDKYEKKTAEYTVGYSFTKERVYELVEYLK